ncbi:MAG TPA: hypothetical protein VEA40_12510 [Ramlibacter sp.]|nr:hypothetical protein [Ramlibacter sp.]
MKMDRVTGSAEQLRHRLHASIRATALCEIPEITRLRQGLRFLAVILLGLCGFKCMTEPGLLILTVETSVLARAASLTKQADAMGWALLLLSMGLVPYQIQQLVAPHWKHRRVLAKLAVLCLVWAGLVWLFLVHASWHMEAGPLWLVMLLNSACCAAVAGAVGDILNGELARALEGSC